MRKYLSNAISGVVDYASYPVGMLLVAPVVLRRLGAGEYGLWMIATAVVSAGGILASGFSDANTQRVANCRATGQSDALCHSVRAMLGINLALGLVAGFAVWAAAPWAAKHVAASQLASIPDCTVCLRLASIAVLVRAVETAAVSTLRGLEQYRKAVQVSTAVRLTTLASAAVLALLGLHTVAILAATAILLAVGTSLQLLQVSRELGASTLLPAFELCETRSLLRKGVFAWLQAAGGVAFAQFDRILLGVSLGAAAVAPYALCVQLSQPIHGLSANGLHFLFPHLSRRAATSTTQELKRTLLRALAVNLAVVAIGAGAALLFGMRILQYLAGSSVAAGAQNILIPIVVGSALMGLSVTGTYAMQAMGEFKTVACISLAGKAAMLLLMMFLLHRAGIQGLAFARGSYGVLALAIYLPLLHRFTIARHNQPTAAPQLELPQEAQT